MMCNKKTLAYLHELIIKISLRTILLTFGVIDKNNFTNDLAFNQYFIQIVELRNQGNQSVMVPAMLKLIMSEFKIFFTLSLMSCKY